MLSIAPMISWTDKNYRFLMRQITRQTVLYTEMVMDSALLHNPDRLEDFIDFCPAVEPPLALQLGGSDPEKLGAAVELSEFYNGGLFSEINLNCGCPSNKAKKAGFGAELMLEPELVRQIVHEMIRKSSKTEITVKCRIGTNKRHSWEDLVEFVESCKAGGVNRMIIHSRICILSGLSPAQNRSVPPLQYDVVHRLVDAFPDMKFVINGGIRSFSEADSHLGLETRQKFRLSRRKCSDPEGEDEDKPSGGCTDWSSNVVEQECDMNPVPLWSASPVHGVMIGREAYNNPWMLADADRYYFGVPNPSLSRREALENYLQYCSDAQDKGEFKSNAAVLCKPLHNFFCGSPMNKIYKRKFDTLIKKFTSGKQNPREVRIDDIVYEAIDGTIPDSFLDERMGNEGYMVPS
mmetsp:Transcript_8976/g.13491  ORF Transcript_8976/g.13491 Transcript_8976/m.13491 type:complete len:406 (-) Transcript_8976:186-1403(-)|eukprot:CAMPEP_0185041424 /NCGR_PEP_ID=MMETSP1103-20130426/40688_1 /TAXON_ID=36769 /ORGANISM="Paraphysomonas bandaiensis, Strain Caron Lab Isolate" /LENGTH=405 /DNA_ID=CAMNT_0027581135 /DNA_START=192 /DNA_END=1409 /DNA_ORIENTATION=-